MKNINLNIHLEGKMTEKHLLPMKFLVELYEKLQLMIDNIAKYDVRSEESINLASFQLILEGLRPSTSVDVLFQLPFENDTLFGNTLQQQEYVIKKIDTITQKISKNDAAGIQQLFPNPTVRDAILSPYFEIIRQKKNLKMSIGSEVLRKDCLIPNFNKSLYENVLPKVSKQKSNETEIYSAIVKVNSRTKKYSGRPLRYVEKLDSATKYSKPFYEFKNGSIVVKLNFPAHCDIEENDEGVIISYLPLNIHACGSDEKEAISDMADELNYVYKHSLSQTDNNITEYAKKIKYGTLLLIREVVNG